MYTCNVTMVTFQLRRILSSKYGRMPDMLKPKNAKIRMHQKNLENHTLSTSTKRLNFASACKVCIVCIVSIQRHFRYPSFRSHTWQWKIMHLQMIVLLETSIYREFSIKTAISRMASASSAHLPCQAMASRCPQQRNWCHWGRRSPWAACGDAQMVLGPPLFGGKRCTLR